MPDGCVEVDRLDRVAAEEMDRIQHLAELDQVLVVHAIADPPAMVEIGHIRGARDGPERGPVAADPEVSLGVPGMKREFRRNGPDPFLDHRRVEPDALAARLDPGSGGSQELAGSLVEEVHSDLGQDPKRGDVDRLELVGRQDRCGRVAYPRLGRRPLDRQDVALVAGPPPAPPSRHGFRLGGPRSGLGRLVRNRKIAHGHRIAPDVGRGTSFRSGRSRGGTLRGCVLGQPSSADSSVAAASTVSPASVIRSLRR